MKIPVFVSCPSTLSTFQASCRQAILGQLEDLQLEPKSVVSSDYPNSDALREVLLLARHCAGGLILGFSQLIVREGVLRTGTEREEEVAELPLPTPWNHVEGSIIYSLDLPMLILKEEGISTGIFDRSVSELFIDRMPRPEQAALPDFRSLLLRWSTAVRQKYYGD